MRVLYVAPRYHTNQIDVVKGWQKRGDEVKFISYYTSIIEDYDVIEPIVLGFSPIFNFIDRIYTTMHRGDIYASGFRIKKGFPPILKYMDIVSEWKPDIIIFRERSLYTVVGYLISKNKSKCILYNQSPLWDEPPKIDFMHRLVYKLTPQYRFTPCIGRKAEGKSINDSSSYIPFVVEPRLAFRDRAYFDNNRINILCVGVFEPRKNHILLIRALNNIYSSNNQGVHLTIIGEASNENQMAFLDEVKAVKESSGISESISIVTNVSRHNMNKYYSEADLFVIPSTREPASISQLEAMSYSVPVICSNTNGSACYVVDGYNGYQFEDDSQTDLEDKILRMIDSKDNIIKMGKNAYESIVENNSFDKYYEGICQIIEKM